MGLVGAPARERARGRAARGVEVGAAIVARGLGYEHRSRRGERRGIYAVDLTVSGGAVVGLLGPNGAGKSTVLGVLMTRLAPGSGELRLLGEDAGRADSSLRRRIGCAPDEPVHFAHLTGLENAVLFGRAAGMSEAAARASADRLLERFGLAADAHRAAGDYSLGMRRKLLLCEALIGAPGLLLLDEPTLGLDAPSRDALASELKANSATGAAIVIATNDLPFAAMVCDRVSFLREGRMVLEGTPAALLGGIGAATWIEIGLAAGGPPRNPPPGVSLVDATDAVLRFRASAGGAVLPLLCQALLAEGCDIRSVQIREPDLRDVFNAVTGESWTPAAADAS